VGWSGWKWQQYIIESFLFLINGNGQIYNRNRIQVQLLCQVWYVGKNLLFVCWNIMWMLLLCKTKLALVYVLEITRKTLWRLKSFLFLHLSKSRRRKHLVYCKLPNELVNWVLTMLYLTWMHKYRLMVLKSQTYESEQAILYDRDLRPNLFKV